MTKKKPITRKSKTEVTSPVYERIREILDSARAGVARSVNTTQVVANWLIGCEIFEEEQRGRARAEYGTGLIRELASQLTAEFGRGFSRSNLEHFRDFYLKYPELCAGEISHAARGKFADWELHKISHAARGKLGMEKDVEISQAQGAKLPTPSKKGQILHSGRGESGETARIHGGQAWQPGWLHPNLSWTHYRTLLRVEKSDIRAFYEIETLQNNWSARELERQINSLLYERLAKSRDKKGLMRLATKGQEIASPADVFKDPVVIEFLGLPESPKLVESDLETALIDNLQAFLLELGKGFAFVARQERITLDGDHFYIDLVFYHVILKCYVLIDLKIDKLTHADLGQMQLYVNYYDSERRTPGDNPTLGLILCTDKNDAVVKYTLGPDQSKKLFASRYQLHLPSEAELQAEIRRELRHLPGTQATNAGKQFVTRPKSPSKSPHRKAAQTPRKKKK